LPNAVCPRGGSVTVSFEVQTEGAPADLHVLSVKVLAPDGKELPAHRTAVLAP